VVLSQSERTYGATAVAPEAVVSAEGLGDASPTLGEAGEERDLRWPVLRLD